jgi:lantibiotic modifying enzyme
MQEGRDSSSDRNLILMYRTGVAWVMMFLLCSSIKAQQHNYIEPALQAEHWLRTQQRLEIDGLSWPDVRDSIASTPELYSGNSGVLLFYLELYHTTRDRQYLSIAEKAADHLLSSFPKAWDEAHTGLYTGAAGIMYALHEADKVLKKKTYGLAVRGLMDSLRSYVDRNRNNPDVANDIVYGYAGVGLAFLYASKERLAPDAMETASAIGDILLGRSLQVSGGIRWPMFMTDTSRHFFMPNFSHGTAGVAYFLARLYRGTGKREYLDAAKSAGRYLISITSPSGMIRHAEPDARAMDRYYVGWCHGPAGTARLYHELYGITKEVSWKEQLGKAARSVMQCGIPQKATAGYWNNVSFCCGNAGIAAFYLDLYRMDKDSAYLGFARVILDDLLRKGTLAGDGIQWVQAENRSQPELLQAQTGLMQGAAGIGLALLRADALQHGRKTLIRLPDDPF